MIYLITGLPGNGKTLYTLWHVRDRAKKESRPVYVSGIPELAVSEWHQIDEEQTRQWFDLPDGAIIIIDEAQRIFRPRPGRGDPPPHVAQLETHRHKGYDIYLITQHPSLIDQNVRRLAGTHRHVQRTFGMQRAVVHEWGEVHMNCELRRNDSSKTNWTFPKDVYSLYKSAEVHTHKVQMPKQVWYLVALLVVLVGLFIFLKVRVGQRLDGKMPGVDKPTSPAASDMKGAPSLTGGFASDAPRPMTQQEYIASLTPRLPDLTYTAPRYDELTKPIDAPFPVGCIQSGAICKCYTQQGTTYKASADFCRNFIEYGGIFRDWSAQPTGQTDRADPAGIQKASL